ncbi:MAG: hypothetical protein J5962_04970, partial [Lachnospiraceae bacterium]|nr:hypothetical protein [Lachnospiraceae bacterium]
MYEFVVGLQIILVIISAFLLFMAIQQKRSDILKDILSIDFFLLIMNTGYLFELLANTEEAALIAFRFGYLGVAYFTTFFLSFVYRFCKQSFDIKYFGVAILFDTFILLLVWYEKLNSVFLSSAGILKTAFGNTINIKYGTLYYVFAIKCLGEAVFALYLLVKQIKKTKDKWAKDNYKFVIVGICFAILGNLIRVLNVIPGYNSIPLILSITIVFTEFVIIQRKATVMVESAHGAIINNMDNAVVIVNTELEFEEANPKAYDLFTELRHFDIGGDITALDFGYVYSDRHIRYERAGCIYEVQVNDIWNNGRIVGHTAVFIDSTDQIKHMKEMEKLKESADLANRAKSRFLANMSHEIRTPINAILGMNEMILRETKNNSVRQYAAETRQSAQALLVIVNDVLDFSKIESGKMELVPVEYKPNNMIEETLNMILDRANMKELEIVTEISPEIPSVLFGDDIRIKQILVNILTNAVKYTNEGNIWFRAFVKKIENDGRALIHFEVEDTGIGIKKEDLDKLFSAFERIDETKNR